MFDVIYYTSTLVGEQQDDVAFIGNRSHECSVSRGLDRSSSRAVIVKVQSDSLVHSPERSRPLRATGQAD